MPHLAIVWPSKMHQFINFILHILIFSIHSKDVYGFFFIYHFILSFQWREKNKQVVKIYTHFFHIIIILYGSIKMEREKPSIWFGMTFENYFHAHSFVGFFLVFKIIQTMRIDIGLKSVSLSLSIDMFVTFVVGHLITFTLCIWEPTFHINE